MSTPNWFVDPRPQTHEIVFPGAADIAASMRHRGEPDEQIETYLAENTITVDVRGLTAGDKAKLDELRFTQDGDAKLAFGENQLVMMEMAIVGWSLDAPVSKETIGRLDPLVAAAILEAIPEGKLLVEGERGGANGWPSSAGTDTGADADAEGRRARALRTHARAIARGKMPSPTLASVTAYADFLRFGVLPHPGGTFDQPVGLMEEMRDIHSAYLAERERLEKQQAERAKRRKGR